MNINQLSKQDLVAIVEARMAPSTSTVDTSTWGQQAPEYYDELQELKEAYIDMELAANLYEQQMNKYREAIGAHKLSITSQYVINRNSDDDLWITLDA